MTTRPTFGLTLLAPPLAFLLRADKRIENRSANVATMAKRHIGHTIALTASRNYEGRPVHVKLDEIAAHVADVQQNEVHAVWTRPVTKLDFQLWAGCWVGTASLDGVLSPTDAAGRKWHKPGEYALILSNVRELEPARPATGGLGFWRALWCSCGRLMAATSPAPCHDCKAAIPEPVKDGWVQESL